MFGFPGCDWCGLAAVVWIRWVGFDAGWVCCRNAVLTGGCLFLWVLSLVWVVGLGFGVLVGCLVCGFGGG